MEALYRLHASALMCKGCSVADVILTPSQRFLLVTLLSHQRPDLMMGKQTPGLRGSYPVGAYRRLIQRGLLTDQGELTPLGVERAGEIVQRIG